MHVSRYLLGLLFFAVFSTSLFAASVDAFLPQSEHYRAGVPRPASILGFELGERLPRHDQLVSYFTDLAKSSDRVELTDIGKTNEFRSQFLITISSKKNIENLNETLINRRLASTSKSGQPLVIWLGYSIHGDEVSGANAAMAVAYYLAAGQSKKIDALLTDTIIVLEPSMNPDGMDRFVTWANTHQGKAKNIDENHIGRHQGWRTGRTNHYGFDLNRDWLLVSQKETSNRLPHYYQYLPHVVGDFHEMPANRSYFFQPGIPSRNNPITPLKNYEITKLLAGFHAKAFDVEQQLYYSEESFDDFYYGKGSTYPDITGAIGILFEQAGTKGLQQQTINGLLTFEDTIRNQVLTSLSTINGSVENKELLIDYQYNYYQQAKSYVEDTDISGYIISEAKDSYRLNALLTKLSQHKIKAYPLKSDAKFGGEKYPAKHSYYIPLLQEQYRLVDTLLSSQSDFTSTVFYDVSGWTLPFAMNIQVAEVENVKNLSVSSTPWQLPTKKVQTINSSAYAYVFEWHHYLAPKLLQEILSENITARVATRNFSLLVDNNLREFSAGSIVVPAGLQHKKNWQQVLSKLSNESGIELVELSTGLTTSGADIGAVSMKALKAIKPLLVGGEDISEYEAAEILFYLDDQLNIPTTIVELKRLDKIKLGKYTHIIFVDGNYKSIKTSTINRLDLWLQQGGVAIGQKRAGKWLAAQGLLQATFINKNEIDQMFDTESLDYKDQSMLESRKKISGAIFNSHLDLSHPLTFGYQKESLPLFKNSTFIISKPTKPFLSVAKYSPSPLLSGHADNNLVNLLANNTAVIAHNIGNGRVIVSTDSLAYRGYWLGSSKLLANSLFFAKAFSVEPKRL